MSNKPVLTQKRLHQLLDYDPLSGIFTWKVKAAMRVMAGQLAGTLSPDGYIRICLDRKNYLAHRLAWLHVHGEFPPKHIDHINNLHADNRLVNLRCATHGENARNQGSKSNNTSGWCGVTFNIPAGKYQAQIGMAGERHNLGLYRSPEIAAAIYNHVVVQVHGEFARPDIPDWLIPDAAFVKVIGGNMKQISKALAAAAIHNAQIQDQHQGESA